jgi:polyisoprenoid-binding protein YceI
VESNGDHYVLRGELTLKGVTKPVALDLDFYGVNPGMGHGEVAGFEASVVLNRKDFGIDIDLPLETGGAVVGDKVTITLEIEAVKQA